VPWTMAFLKTERIGGKVADSHELEQSVRAYFEFRGMNPPDF
jgi:hypothetical protein